MLDVADSLVRALGRARYDLGAAAANTARAQTAPGAPKIDGAMASVAERAIFTEALLAATHARLEEVKSVTK